MQAVKAYYDGTAFVPLTPVKAKLNQSAIITILEDTSPKGRLDGLFGILSKESADEMLEALKDTERVDFDGW